MQVQPWNENQCPLVGLNYCPLRPKPRKGRNEWRDERKSANLVSFPTGRQEKPIDRKSVVGAVSGRDDVLGTLRI